MRKAALLVLLAGCPTEDTNPKTLWLVSDQIEAQVKLIDHEPPPF